MDRTKRALGALDLAARGIEVGPSYSPLLPKGSGARVETVDHATREELVEKYRAWAIPDDKLEQIEEVDHLWSGGSLLDAIPEHGVYDFVIASHFIEHTVDLIGFLQDCEALLTDTGRLSLVVPDKRYCFDRFKPLTSLGQVVDAHLQPTRFHPAGPLLDHQTYAAVLGGAIAWSAGQEGGLGLQFVDLAGGDDAIANGTGQAEYFDTHRWIFTPTSFELLLADLRRLGFHHFGIVCRYPTEGFEFFVTLQRDHPGETADRLEQLLTIEQEQVAMTVGRADRDVRAAAEEAAQLRAELAAQRAVCASMTAELADLRASTSWRATAPLRAVSGRLRRRP